MEAELADLLAELETLWRALLVQARSFALPSRLVQLAVLLGCLLGALAFRRLVGPPLHDWMRTRDGWPRWRLRVLVVLHRRLRLIGFVALAWLSVAVMAEVSNFVSRRYLLELVATIATAWLLVGLATRLIRNLLLRRVVAWGLWIYVTIYYLGFSDSVASILDSIAIEAGTFRISALTFMSALVMLGVLMMGARLLARTAATRIRANPDISPSMQVLAVKVLQLALYGAAAFIGLKAVGFDLTGLAVLSGAIGLGLGFGLQKVVSNLVSGVIILLDKSIKPGDVISLGETFGWIQSLGARYVSVVTRDGREFLIPNEDLITGQVVNWSHSDEFVRLDIHFGTSYANDPHVVRRLAVEAAAGVDRVLHARRPVCHITGFGDSSVDYILRFWISDPSAGLTNIRGNVFLALWDAFQANGISIPFPQREVRMLGQPAEARGDAGAGDAPR